MIDWRDSLYFDEDRKAKFRDAYFYVDSVDTGLGRRNVLHQYPFKDEPYLEDLGPDADEFIINAYVVQNKSNGHDYTTERDLLASALRKKGPGTLIHPSYGEMSVGVKGKVRITEAYGREGGIARFTITFVQAGISKFPEDSVDYVAITDALVEKGLGYIKDSFAGNEITNSYAPESETSSGYIHSGPSEERFQSNAQEALKMTKSVITSSRFTIDSTMMEVLDKLDEDIDDFTDNLASACGVAGNIVDGIGRVVNLVGIPDSITRRVTGRCSSLVYGATSLYPTDDIPQKLGKSIVKSLVELNKFGTTYGSSDSSIYGGGLKTVTVSSPMTARESFNQMLLINLVREAALLNAVRVAVRTAFESYNDAIDIMNSISDAIDDLLERLGDQSASTTYDDYGLFIDNEKEYSTIEDLRSKFVKAMFEIGADLAKIEEYECPPTIMSTLELAYMKYGDIDRENEIQERNRDLISNPCFLPDSKTIEILSE